ncbi:hypothetical protein KC318_g1658 [Hortaea werneckii]|nr:hypothetical protein KC334_g1372 [Hortaea werneckii]KAI7014372.1 hypothetical protein KC355_g4715 [Hortaea werneckii]KAI7203723.1 hypothetical protein KC324_g1122 [Hortaea werneckii]KAI7594349.1 hypothetical protein KC316_g1179 [Hortaea werneckii]KAI7674323.1 hypothetical protein KC318_g1658 [Hortaea werneckii]
MSRRELKNLAVDGADALITGYFEDIPSLVYYWRGDYYEHDGSAESAAWAEQGALAKRLGPHYFHLEGIVGDRTVDGQKQYLAHWSKYSARTWEPAKCFNAADIAAYNAKGVESGDADVAAARVSTTDLPERQEGPSDSTDSNLDTVQSPTLGSRSEDAAVAELQESVESSRHEDDSTMLSYEYLADESTQKNGNEGDDDEQQKCNDVLGSGLVDEHGEEALRCTSHLHKGEPVQCCDICRNEALEMLTEEQSHSLEKGADMALCYVCGEAAIDSDTAFECKCSKLDQCGVCLLQIAEKLASARAALDRRVEDERCGGCRGELDEERVSSCAACGGLKVQWSMS